jgi:hypothetical protein
MRWNLNKKRILPVLAVVGFHACVTTFVYLISKSALLPQLSPDSLVYQRQIAVLAGVLTMAGVAAWFFALLPLHIKLYTLCFVLFGWWGNLSILSFEPLNALYYLAILYLVFKLSEQVFKRTTGLLAAGIVGLWPSFLIHTTQPLRDPLFIMLALLFIFINLRWLTKDYSLRKALAVVAIGTVTEIVLWFTRSDMWEVMIAIAFVTCGMLIIKLSKERKAIWGNLVGAILLLVISVLIPRVALQFYAPAYHWAASYGVESLAKDDATADNNQSVELPVPDESKQIKSYLPARISRLRERFIISYPGAGSNIDTDVRFQSTADIIGYLPRAFVIGFFAPFPQMWFATGTQNGRIGRIIGGTETFCLYIIELMALIGLWHKRHQLAAWLLCVIPIMGMMALGLVVTNVGALYRMRFVFVMLLVILGSEGIRQTLRLISSKRSLSAVEIAAA